LIPSLKACFYSRFPQLNGLRRDQDAIGGSGKPIPCLGESGGGYESIFAWFRREGRADKDYPARPVATSPAEAKATATAKSRSSPFDKLREG
jgi:hypothetical protein